MSSTLRPIMDSYEDKNEAVLRKLVEQLLRQNGAATGTIMSATGT